MCSSVLFFGMVLLGIAWYCMVLHGITRYQSIFLRACRYMNCSSNLKALGNEALQRIENKQSAGSPAPLGKMTSIYEVERELFTNP